MSDSLFISLPSSLTSVSLTSTIPPSCGMCQISCETAAQTCSSGCEACEASGEGCGTMCETCQGCETTCESTAQNVPPSGTLTVVTRTSSSISVSGTSLTYAVSYQFAFRLASETEPLLYETASTSYSFSGLSPDTDYVVNYRGKNSDGVFGPFMVPGLTVTTQTVTPWSWYASNGVASAAQTTAARNAVVNGTELSNFTYLVWNDLVDKIYEAITAAGYSWNTLYSTYSSARMSSSDKTLYAYKFNSARYNLGLHQSTGISEVSPGDPVLGSYFTTIATVLNTFISTL